MNHKVISASAGSGKTYRLSMEYISLIIKNLDNIDFHFDKILVITFTRKAAAEIRTKIFKMLDTLLLHRDQGLIKELEIMSETVIDEEKLMKIKEINVKIRTQKDKVRISTIDSLINQVFKSMIAPLMHLSHYSIEENANKKIWEDLFDELIRDNETEALQRISALNPQKNIESVGRIFNALIEDRWVLHFILKSGKVIRSAYTKDFIDYDTLETEKQASYDAFVKIFRDYIKSLKKLIIKKLEEKKKNDAFDKYFKKDFLNILSSNRSFDFERLEENFESIVESFINENLLSMDKKSIEMFLKAVPFYSKVKIRNGEEYLESDKLSEGFERFVYYHYAVEETFSIINLWLKILDIYDRLKKKSGILSYSDVTWFTYSYLYNKEYSMIDHDNFIVENQFYEFLSVRNQYLLIDEFQDTSLMQFLVLAPMIKDLSSGNSVFDDTSVIIVGDEKQSIYGWRGGQKGLLAYMQEFLSSNIESLAFCYRTVQPLMNYINCLFKEDNFYDFMIDNPSVSSENWFYKGDVKSAKEESISYIENYFFDNSEKEQDKETAYFEFVEKLILPFFEKSGELGKSAIIARENSQLEMIAGVLTDYGIPFVRESSQSIFSHSISGSVINLLKFIQYRDYNALLRFLRSDIVLLESHKLKEIAKKISEYEKKEKSDIHKNICLKEILSDIPEYQKISSLYQRYELSDKIRNLYENPLTVCYDIIDTFEYLKIYKNENDIKNLHSFLSIVSEFQVNPKEYPVNIDGFLRYCEDLDYKKQMSMSLDNAITLLTIHKSKGLGYKNVFLYIDVNEKRSFPSPVNIDFLIDSVKYNDISDCFLSINYRPFYKSIFYDRYKLIEHKQRVEEINNLYVAFTRAEYALSVFWVYKEKHLDEENTIKSRLLKLALDFEREKKEINTVFEDRLSESLSELNKPENESNNVYVKDFFDIKNRNIVLSDNEDEDSKDINIYNAKELFIDKKSKLFGNAIHFYLSFVRYNLESEHQIAKLQTIRLYGNILKRDEIEQISLKVKEFIQTRPDIFDTEWDKVFNEYTVIDDKKRLFRIDRLMINTEKKIISIIDYKTGQISDKDQINLYISLIKKFKEFKTGNYSISGEFVSV